MLNTWLAVISLGFMTTLVTYSQPFILKFAAINDGGDSFEAVGTLVDDKGTLATIALLGTNPSKASFKNEKGEDVPLKLLIHDSTSRLTLLELPESYRAGLPVLKTIGESTSLAAGDAVVTDLSKKNLQSRIVSHVKRHNGKILPLTFIKFNHPEGIQKAGTPVYSTENKLVAFVFQKDVAEKTMFALPIEVLDHVKRSFEKGHSIYKPCWIGVSMDQLNDAPVIVGVRPDTPARKAGLLKDDVVLSIASKKVDDYTAVVNAFYYLEAGKATSFKVLRGTELLTLDVTPEVNPLFK